MGKIQAGAVDFTTNRATPSGGLNITAPTTSQTIADYKSMLSSGAGFEGKQLTDQDRRLLKSRITSLSAGQMGQEKFDAINASQAETNRAKMAQIATGQQLALGPEFLTSAKEGALSDAEGFLLGLNSSQFDPETFEVPEEIFGLANTPLGALKRRALASRLQEMAPELGIQENLEGLLSAVGMRPFGEDDPADGTNPAAKSITDLGVTGAVAPKSPLVDAQQQPQDIAGVVAQILQLLGIQG